MSAVLRKAILDSGLSANDLSRRTRVPTSTITRFLAGKDMRLSRAEKLAAFLGLQLTSKPNRGGRT